MRTIIVCNSRTRELFAYPVTGEAKANILFALLSRSVMMVPHISVRMW